MDKIVIKIILDKIMNSLRQKIERFENQTQQIHFSVYFGFE